MSDGTSEDAEGELSPELLVFEAYLHSKPGTLKVSRAQLHSTLQLLHDALLKSYDGAMTILLERSTAANECSRFSKALGDAISSRTWSESTRKAYMHRLKEILSQHAGLPPALSFEKKKTTDVC